MKGWEVGAECGEGVQDPSTEWPPGTTERALEAGMGLLVHGPLVWELDRPLLHVLRSKFTA